VVLLAAGAVAAAALGGMLGWMGKRLRAGSPPPAMVATAGPAVGAASAPSIGVEPLAPRPRLDQLAVPVPPAAVNAPAAAAETTPSPEEPARTERPRRRKKLVSDLAAKKNPF
jgi:hypothetical protein